MTPDITFEQFAHQFVRCYWEEVARGAPEFAGHSEPCDRTPEELLQEIKYEASLEFAEGGSACETMYALRMMDTAGDVWRFWFRHGSNRWFLVRATSGSSQDEARVDLLDEVYGHWFRSFLERIMDNASNQR